MNHSIWMQSPWRILNYGSVFSRTYSKLQLDIAQSIVHDAGNDTDLQRGDQRKLRPYIYQISPTFRSIIRHDRATRGYKVLGNGNLDFGLLSYPEYWMSESLLNKLVEAFKVTDSNRRRKSSPCTAFRTWFPENWAHENEFEYAAHCIKYNKLDMLQNLLLKNNGLIFETSSFGDNLLLISCNENNYSISVTLIESGALVNSDTFSGKTPLHAAAKNRNVDMIKLLVDKGALQSPNRYGETPYLSFLLSARRFVKGDIETNMSALSLLVGPRDVSETEIISKFIAFLSETNTTGNSFTLRQSRWVRNITRLMRNTDGIVNTVPPGEYGLHAFGILLIARHLTSVEGIQPIVFKVPLNSVADFGAVIIGKYLLSQNKILELNLDGNDIADVGFKGLFSEIRSECDLRLLSLRENTISDASATLLADIISSKCHHSLTELDVSNTNLSESGLLKLILALKATKTVRKIGLGGNMFSPEVCASLPSRLYI